MGGFEYALGRSYLSSSLGEHLEDNLFSPLAYWSEVIELSAFGGAGRRVLGPSLECAQGHSQGL